MNTARPLVQTYGLSAPARSIALDWGGDGLAGRARAGDRAAFTALMRAHKDDLYRFIRRRTGDGEEAYDLVQEAFVSAWKAIDRLDPERPFVAWLRAIALNKIRDRARRAAVRRVFWGRAPGDAERVRDESPSPEDAVVAKDQLGALQHALAVLPAQLREALMLTAVDGLSQAAAAAALGCSIKSIEYRVFRAREILARELGL